MGADMAVTGDQWTLRRGSRAGVRMGESRREVRARSGNREGHRIDTRGDRRNTRTRGPKAATPHGARTEGPFPA
ncbi:hypothetical protein B005_0759 [Nocardiopsis alba ATCC BAA-2165]|uniref:Uncharacterized protein n=1 Tax=Nocardiopsis alba (strain ATCC BAA-2165 / BE74) TaxID=1205910 RepID=J7LE08_NOCAA|nr:hypothetical protein B005_0759 [Nocardiopsis alba ATCC BAA-2165]